MPYHALQRRPECLALIHLWAAKLRRSGCLSWLRRCIYVWKGCHRHARNKQHIVNNIPMIRHQCMFHDRHFVAATTARHQHQQFHWTRVQLCTEASGLMGQCPDYPVCNQASHETRPCMPIWFASGSHGTMPRMPASTPLLGDALLRNTYNIHSSKRHESASVTTSGSHGLDERLRRYAQGCHVPQVPRAAPDHLQHVLPLALRAIGTRCSARGCFSCRCRRSPGAT